MGLFKRRRWLITITLLLCWIAAECSAILPDDFHRQLTSAELQHVFGVDNANEGLKSSPLTSVTVVFFCAINWGGGEWNRYYQCWKFPENRSKENFSIPCAFNSKNLN